MKECVRIAILVLLIVGLFCNGVPVRAQEMTEPQPIKKSQKTKKFSPKLQLVGGVMVVVGVLMLIPSGDTYTVFGKDYCVETYSVSYGGCYVDSTLATAVLIAIGTGAAFMVIGSRKVAIVPVPMHKGFQAMVRVRW